VRVSAALALGMIGDASATASLTYALNDEHDEAVRGALETALDMIKKNIMKKKMRPFGIYLSGTSTPQLATFTADINTVHMNRFLYVSISNIN
jgi:HEAT repeat protein